MTAPSANPPTERRLVWWCHPRAAVGHYRYSLTSRTGRVTTILEQFDGVRWVAATPPAGATQ